MSSAPTLGVCQHPYSTAPPHVLALLHATPVSTAVSLARVITLLLPFLVQTPGCCSVGGGGGAGFYSESTYTGDGGGGGGEPAIGRIHSCTIGCLSIRTMHKGSGTLAAVVFLQASCCSVTPPDHAVTNRPACATTGSAAGPTTCMPYGWPCHARSCGSCVVHGSRGCRSRNQQHAEKWHACTACSLTV
jgi:hypothetical protein